MPHRSLSRASERATRVCARGWLVASGMLAIVACSPAPRLIELPPLDDAGRPIEALPVSCEPGQKTLCAADIFYRCEASEEFIETIPDDCPARGLHCNEERGCVTCSPGDRQCKLCGDDAEADCNPDTIQQCRDDGSGWDDLEVCELEKKGEVCFEATCRNACEVAQELRGYVGCEFFAADLDNAALSDMNNASAQQYAVAVANPSRVVNEVWVELNEAPFGEPAKARELERRRVAPGDLEVFRLPRREVDGSSERGLNDGTHSALTSNAYRVRSILPITAYQFNPLENVNVFSNDASLLYPLSALGSTYTVVGWPQTIGDSDNPDQDFDSTTSDDDLRAFLTVLGTKEQTHVRFELGSKVMRVVGAGLIPASGPGDVIELDVGPFDVINLETEGFNADFTGTLIQANNEVSVFVGSEASDVPMFGTYAKRQCCADHLEEQLLPDTSAGTDFLVARMPPRTRALNAAAVGRGLGVADVEEPEWIRVVAITDGETRIQTTLDSPNDDFMLPARGDVTLRADHDVLIHSDSPIHVLQALGSQGVTGIPRQYPGGDPSIIAVPPIQQYRRDYIFLTPDKYVFDFVTITAPKSARVKLDGADLPETCPMAAVDGFPMGVEVDGATSTTEWVVYRCQLAFPEIQAGSNPVINPGVQEDGVHTVVSDQEVAIIVYGFDRFVSYAYVGGLDFDVLQ